MIKYLTYDLQDEYGIHVHIYNPNYGLEKVASAFSDELREALDAIKPDSSKTYVLVNAMSAGEYYGPNRNGDYFPEDVLLQYHKTFETLANVFKHHQNKLDDVSLGKVVFAYYNPVMHRVELILELDNERAKDIIHRIANKENVAVSMGCRVPYDVCSICGNKAKKIHEYCDHLQRAHILTTYPDGRRSYMINTQPKFFDISFVTIPADETAGVIMKVAEQQLPERSADTAETLMKNSGKKEADLIKEVEGEVAGMSQDPKALIVDSQPDMSKDDLIAVVKKYPISEILSTFLNLRIMPKPHDFQRLVLYKAGLNPLADYLDRERLVFPTDMEPAYPDDISYSRFNPELARDISHMIPRHSLTKPLVIIRVMQKRAELASPTDGSAVIPPSPPDWRQVKKDEIKKNPVKNPFLALLGIGGLYAAYNKMMSLGGTASMPELESTLLKNPWLWPLLLGGTALAATQIQDLMFNKHAGMVPVGDASLAKKLIGPGLKSILVGVPATYMYAGYQEAKAQRGEPVSEFGNVVRKHPFLSSIVGAGLLHKVLKAPFLKTASFNDILYSLSDEALTRVYEDTIQ